MGEKPAATDEELMELVQACDYSALEQLIDRYRLRLYAFCHRNLGLLGVPDSEVDDVFQETWIRVVRSAERFDTQRRFTTWLFSIALNLCRDARRRRRLSVGTNEDVSDWEPQPEPDQVPEPFARLSQKQSREAVGRLLAQLPDPMREVVTLRYYEDMDLGDIAEVIQIPVGTVKSRLHHAIRRIRELAAGDRTAAVRE